MSKARELPLNVALWRDRLQVCKIILGNECLRILSSNDEFFDSKDGVNAWAHIRSGKASLEKTSRAVLILEDYIRKTRKRHMKNINKVEA